MTRYGDLGVLMTPVTLLGTGIGRGGRPFFLLFPLLSIQQRDRVRLVLRLGVLERSSGGRMMVVREVQETLLCLVVGKVIL
jgi:hypothetical protein